MTRRLLFLRREDGQDMVEYVLILGFIAIVSAAIMVSMSGDINTIWSVANNRLTEASK